jgi:hypothetical protein
MVMRTLCFDNTDPKQVHAQLAAVIEASSHDAVVQLRVTGALPAGLTAATLPAMALKGRANRQKTVAEQMRNVLRRPLRRQAVDRSSRTSIWQRRKAR